MTDPKGFTYNGQWKEGVRHGQGVEKYNNPNGYPQTFEGTYENGYRKYGKQLAATGTDLVYEGDWDNHNLYHGFGTFYTTSGEKEAGNWEHGKKHGTFQFTNIQTGSTYTRSFTHGQQDCCVLL